MISSRSLNFETDIMKLFRVCFLFDINQTLNVSRCCALWIHMLNNNVMIHIMYFVLMDYTRSDLTLTLGVQRVFKHPVT